MHFRTKCHPEANGRKPEDGEYKWDFTFTLDDGQELIIGMGEEAHDDFRSFILREELDDAADEAQGKEGGDIIHYRHDRDIRSLEKGGD